MYQVPDRIVPFEFMDGDLAGLTVDFRRNLSLDDYFGLLDLLAAADEPGFEGVRNLIHKVAEIGLVGWNLEDGNGPVAATPEALTAHLPVASALQIVRRYLSEIGALPDPLAPPSAAGDSSAKRPAKSRRRNSPAPSSSNA